MMKGTVKILLALAIFNSEVVQSQAISLISGSYSTATATGSGSGGNASLTYTAPSGANRMLVFAMSVERDHKPLPTGDNWANPAVLGGTAPTITFGGNTMTLLSWSISYWATAPVSEANTNVGIELLVYALSEANIPTGSNTFTIASNYNNPTNAGDESIFAAMVFDNVASATNMTHDGCGTCNTVSTSPIDPLNANNALVALSAAGSNRTYTAGTGYTLIGSTTTTNTNGTYTSASISEKDGNAFGAQFITGTASTQTSPFTISGDAKTFGVTEIVLRMATSTALPVTLIDFAAQKKQNDVELKWSTASEINSDYFTIERSTDGENFIHVANVEGNGNSNQITEYAYLDKSAPQGTVFYKLKQTDYDGTTVAFDVQTVHMEEQMASRSVFPNPCAECNYVDITGDPKSVKEVSITDNLGNAVLNEVYVTYAPGSTMRINFTKALSAGMYTIRVNTNEEWASNRFIVK